MKAPRSRGARRGVGITCLLLVDVLAVLAAVLVAKMATASVAMGAEGWAIFVTASCVAVPGVATVSHFYGLRTARRLRYRRMGAAAGVICLMLVIAGVAGISLEAAVAATLLAVAFLSAGQALYDLALRTFFGFDPERPRSLLVGSDAALDVALREQWASMPHHRSGIIGRIGDTTQDLSGSDRADIPALGKLRDIESIVGEWCPDEIVVLDPGLSMDDLADLAELCRRRRITLKLVDLEMRFEARGVCLVPNTREAIFVAAPAAPGCTAWVIKRGADVVVSAALLVLLSPFLLAVALAIKLTSPGPVFYSAERVGLGQRRFRCHKFRTMRDGADLQQAELEALNEADGALFKIRDDPRVTRVGRWLRRTSIDELPQLVNVLEGTMSIVGPRPLPLRDNNLLKPWHRQRHVVLPGLTGLWQVSGRSDASFDDMIRLDLDYVDNWSLRLDLSIAWRTVKAVLGRRGAC